jgi:hypothetical protein
MPHDCNGNLLKVGDEVVFRGTITQISEGSETCNLTLVSCVPAKEGHWNGMTATAYQCELTKSDWGKSWGMPSLDPDDNLEP